MNLWRRGVALVMAVLMAAILAVPVMGGVDGRFKEPVDGPSGRGDPDTPGHGPFSAVVSIETTEVRVPLLLGFTSIHVPLIGEWALRAARAALVGARK